MSEKPLIWVGGSLAALRGFPEEARRHAGHELHRVQVGLEPTDWKPITSVGPGVREIRVRTDRAYRVIYLAKFADAIYVLHAFEKRSQQTARTDLAVARDRYRALLAQRRTDRGVR